MTCDDCAYTDIADWEEIADKVHALLGKEGEALYHEAVKEDEDVYLIEQEKKDVEERENESNN